MVNGGESSSHQPTRVNGCLPGTQTIPACSEAVDSDGHVGQLHRSGPDQESGRHSLRSSLQLNQADLPLVGKKSSLPVGPSPSRASECQSRQPQQEVRPTSHRVVTSSEGMQSNLEALGSSARGSLCNPRKLSSRSVRFSVPKPSSLEDGRIIVPVGQSVGVRLSSNLFDILDDQQAKRSQQRKASSGRSKLARSGLVSSAPRDAGRSTEAAPSVPGSPQAGSLQARQSRDSKSARLAVIKRGLISRGFSSAAAKRIANPNRKSTAGVYQAKWSCFSSWCSSREIDPRSASVPVVADFFTHLRDEKKLSVPTIKGYRSSLARVLSLGGTDISTSQEISALIRSFSQEIPKQSVRLPKWDLSLVLSSLRTSPYEPLVRADIKMLTFKTVFLLALASAKRVSELQGLSSAVSFSISGNVAFIEFDHLFIAKTDRPSDISSVTRHLSVPAISDVTSDPDDLLLCPVRALKEYLSRTRDRRPFKSRLFLPITGSADSVTRNTISRWIRMVIRLAYQGVNQDLLDSLKISAHEVRALSTSVAFQRNLSVPDVMQAASWRCQSTFASFYLRDLTAISGQLFSLGPMVAAQRVIHPL